MSSIKINKKTITQKVARAIKNLSSTSEQKRMTKQDRGHAEILTEQAGAIFEDVLHRAINESSLSEDAINALSNIKRTPVYYMGNNKFSITIYFDGDLSRPSLQEKQYGRIDNIVALLNNGVDHVMKPVYGYWENKDKWVPSKTHIEGANFVEKAVEDFNSKYSSKYRVIGIEINGIYDG